MPKLSILCWNLNSGIAADTPDEDFEHEKFLSRVATVIRASGADVACLQEFPLDRDQTLIEELAKRSQLDSFHYMRLSDSHLRAGIGLGLCTLTRLPIVSRDQAILPTPKIKISTDRGDIQPIHDKGLLITELSGSSGNFRIMNIHLPPFFSLRRDPSEQLFSQMSLALGEIIEKAQGPLILCGDINTSSILDFLRPQHSLNGLVEMLRAPTRRDGRKTETTMVRGPFLPLQTRCFGTYSDHSACLSDIWHTGKDTAEKRKLTEVSPRQLNLLLLTDLHLGKGETSDTDWKVDITDAERETRSRRLKEYIRACPIFLDLALMAGDFTIRGDESGFQQAQSLILELMREGKLPPRDRIIVSPGNHDVERRTVATAAASVSKNADRFQSFRKYIGDNHPRPFFLGDVSEGEILSQLEQSLERGEVYLGGVKTEINSTTGQAVTLNFPFIFDRDKDIFIYTFNSASISGSELRLPGDADGGLDALQQLVANANSGKIKSTLDALLSNKLLDGSRINPSEIYLFRSIVSLLREKMGARFAKALKIAVFHHHVSTIFGEEVKSFEVMLNAGKIKKELATEGFDLIFHGHKHWPEVFLDTSVTGELRINVISGSTIGGPPATGSAGFYIASVDREVEEVKIFFVPIADQNPNRVFADALAKPVYRFGYGSRRESSGTKGLAEGSDPINLAECLRASSERLSSAILYQPSRLRVGNSDDLAIRNVAGWNNFIDRPGITILGTAYAVDALWSIGDLQSPIHASRHAIAAYLDGARRDNGFWSSAGSGEPGQPIETCAVLRALSRLVGPREFEGEVDRFESWLLGCGETVFGSNYLAAMVLEFFVDFRIESPLVANLSERLITGAGYLYEFGALAWPVENTLCDGARADDVVVSLGVSSIVARLLPKLYEASAGRVGMQWSRLAGTLEYIARTPCESELISVRQTNGVNLFVNLFNDALTLRCLVAAGRDVDDALLSLRLNKLRRTQIAGLWSGPQKLPTTWATLDAVAALIEVRRK